MVTRKNTQSQGGVKRKRGPEPSTPKTTTGKNMGTKKRESDFNTRRYAENFPLIVRGQDRFSDEQKFEMEYELSDHPHTVELDLFIRENPEIKILPTEWLIMCQTNCPWYLEEGTWYGNIFGGGLPTAGAYYAAFYDKFNINVGGWEHNRQSGGVIVPLDGYYLIRMYAPLAGVTNWGPGWASAQIRAGGAVLATQNLYEPSGPRYFGKTVDFTTTAYLTAGTTVGGWMAAWNIAYFTAYNFCTFWGGTSLELQLVGV